VFTGTAKTGVNNSCHLEATSLSVFNMRYYQRYDNWVLFDSTQTTAPNKVPAMSRKVRFAAINANQDTPPTPTESPPSESTPDDNTPPPTPHTAKDLSPHQIATKRAEAAKARLAIAHEGWTLARETLVTTGILRTDEAIWIDLNQFGEAICEQYATATFLFNVLANMPEADWFGPKEKFDDTLRRLNTLKGLEANLVVWERMVLEMVNLADGEVGGDELSKVPEGWRTGMPGEP
jgi:hypothetical protein